MKKTTILAGSLLLSAYSASAVLTSVLSYDADGGTGSGTPGALAAGTAITDLSGAGNDAATIGTVSTVEDDPTNTAGELSFSFTGATSRITTNNVDLLTSQLIADNGGYTMSTWFRTTGAGNQQFLGFAGTDGLRLAGGTLQVNNHRGGSPVAVPGATGLNDGEWHQVLLEFDTSGDADGNATSTDLIAGLDAVVTVTLDGTVIPVGTVSTGTFGDTLDRAIGIGGHSEGFATENFDGELYNPSVSLGIAVPEPSTGLLAALAGLGLMARRRR